MTGEPSALSDAARALLERRARAGRPDEPRSGLASAESPLAYPQLPQWVFASLYPDDPAYNLPKRLQLSGRLDAEALRTAIEAIASRHDVLRSAFRLVDGEPAQILLPPRPLEWSVADLRRDPEEAPGWLDRDARKSFRLEQGHLVRAFLVRTSDHEWVLQVTFHHLAFDGWSTGVFFDELGPAYEATRMAAPPSLPALALRYADFAVWQRRREASAEFERDRRFWTERLAGREASLRIPADWPAGERRMSPAAGVARIHLEPRLAGLIRDFALRSGTTPGAAMLAGFALLLGRRASRSSVVVGQVTAGRTHLAFERLVGTFVSTFPLAADLPPDPTFASLVDAIRRESLLEGEHACFPPDRLVARLHPEGRLGQSPAFDAVFNFRNFPLALPAFEHVDVTGFEAPRLAALADMSLEITEPGGGLLCELAYDAERFAGPTAERCLAGYASLLEAAVTAPDSALGRLPVMGPIEQQIVTTEWSRGPKLALPAETIITAFEAQAARTPDAIAVQAAGLTVTYRELDRLAICTATMLVRHGVGRGDFVGIRLERSVELVVAMLGVLKAGAAYVPIDPADPTDRVRFVVGDAGIKVLIGDDIDSPPDGLATVRLGADGRAPSDAGSVLAFDQAGFDDPAYVMYTSGSTGRPKGAIISHRGIANHMRWMQGAYPCNSTDVVIQKTPVTFDGSVWEFYAPLLAGGRLIMARPDGHRDAAYLLSTIREAGITILQAVPTLLRLLIDTGGLASCPSLRRVFCGGEALTPELVKAFLAASPAQLINLYGPTEVTINAATWAVSRTTFDGRVAIGGLVANTSAYILDNERHFVPIGTWGELYLGGPGVASGYLNRPDLTAERFQPDLFDARQTMYRTGDQVRWRSDRNLEYMGRLDHQVKLRGLRIELGEIEAALAAAPGVAASAAAIHGHTDGDQRLVGYIVFQADAARDLDQIFAAIRCRLPGYMVPSVLIPLEALPLMPNGKLDRRALPSPGVAILPAGPAPRSPLEQAIAELMASLLGVPALGRDDDFFRAGGHSLLAMRLLGQLRTSRAPGLQLSAVFDHPTPASLAAFIEHDETCTATDASTTRPHHSPALIEVHPTGNRRPFFMVHGDVVGSGLYCRLISRSAGDDLPVYAFPPRSDLDSEDPGSVEDMARRNLAQVRRIQPHGPYRLGGHCLSGLVAFEMAQQLRQAGEAVELLVLVDTRTGPWQLGWLAPRVRGAVGLTTRQASARRVRTALVMDRLDHLRRTGWWTAPLWLAGYVLRFLRRRLAGRTQVKSPGLPPGTAADQVLAFQSQMALRYCARPYPDPVLFVSATGADDARLEAPAGWRLLVPRLEVVRAEATHVAVVTSHLPALIAERLKVLDRPLP